MRNLSIRSALVLAALALSFGLAGCAGENGADGTSCTVEQDDATSVATITCDDGTTAEVTAGVDGSSCTVEDNDDGTKTISCDDGTEVTVSDGTPGDQGEPGEQGEQGEPGEVGDPCTAVDNGDGTTTVTCGEDEVVISDGAPGSSCTVTDNGDGSRTISCEDGSEVTVFDGVDGESADNFGVTNFHGIGHLQSTGEFEEADKHFVDAVITSASADEAGVVIVDFTVTEQDEEATPVEGLTGVSAIIAKLVPASGDISWNTWVPYNYRTQTVAGDTYPMPNGTSAIQATTENTGILTELGGGAYTYTFATDISAVTGYDGNPVEYDRSLVHRVSVMMGGHSGATADAVYDFVPDGTENTESRDIVQTETCQNCHGWEFHGHGGNRLTVENCVTCHNAGNTDPHSGEDLDFKVMIHKIHAGGELQSIPGEDGEVWDDPATEEDESADNGSYGIYGYRETLHEWWKVGFPARIENCTACHQGDGAEVDNWEENASRAACGSCHDEIDFTLPADEGGHEGGAQDEDDCLGCHNDGLAPSVAGAHDWLANDPRMDEEFDITVTVSEPLNGEYFEDGESPIVTIVVNDAGDGALILGSDIASDATGEGCLLVDADDDGDWDPCPDGDGLFTTAQMFVSGPRAQRTPVLTTGARAQILSGTTGTWDLSAIANNAAALSLTVDGGGLVHGEDAVGGDTLLPGIIEVKMVTASFPTPAAATTDEIVAWLNANTSFAARAIAWNDAGKVGIRSRNLGPMHAIQLRSSPVATTVFAGDLAAKTPSITGSYASNKLYSDVKAVPGDDGDTFTYQYNLDPVDDLGPGTYAIRVEFADAGSIRGSDPPSFRATSSARATFQVGQAEEEPFVARNCSTCHRGPNGVGMDFHTNKQLDDAGAETCGACHDYQPQYATSTDPSTGRYWWGSTGPSLPGSLGWTGAKPISRRVHAVHFGSSLNYPNATVDHSDEPVGRNWDITLPQDVRNCETCHPADTSGTWATNPSLTACSGCHDSDAATAHMQSMRFDATPANPWSGDETEACAACHAASDEGGGE